MSDSRPFASLSNDAFFQVLKSHEKDKSWTIGMLAEYQKRGERNFDFDLKLVTTLNKLIRERELRIQKSISKYEKQISEYMRPFREIGAQIASQSQRYSEILSELRISPENVAEKILDDPELVNESSNSFKTRAAELEIIQIEFGPLLEIGGKIELNTRWGRKQTANLWGTWISAIAAIAATVLGILSLLRK